MYCMAMPGLPNAVYELWFKQMLYEIDSVRELLSLVPFDERKQLVINQRMGRVISIGKVSGLAPLGIATSVRRLCGCVNVWNET